MTESSKPTPAAPEKYHSYPFYAPRFWHGMRFGTWMSLMARNRFRITPWRWFMCFNITLTTIANSALYYLQRLIYGRRIDNTPLIDDPIFIVGHWRSGTTYLHELFVLDERLASPTTHECFVPNHSLLTRIIFNTVLKFMLPANRPMDNVVMGWERPQEDEFALCNLGLGSPYSSVAFPNNPPIDQEYLGMEAVPPERRQRWKDGFQWFLKLVTYRSGKRIVLKSPTHTARIKILLEMYPNAKFIHIVREPFVVFPSTIRLWKSLDQIQGCQVPTSAGLEEQVFETFERMYEKFEVEQHLIPAGNLYNVRYEDLVKDTVGQMQAIYNQLRLGDFEPVRAKVEGVVAASKEYKTNKFDLDPELKAQIAQRWGAYRRRYGYEVVAPVAEPVTIPSAVAEPVPVPQPEVAVAVAPKS